MMGIQFHDVKKPLRHQNPAPCGPLGGQEAANPRIPQPTLLMWEGRDGAAAPARLPPASQGRKTFHFSTSRGKQTI